MAKKSPKPTVSKAPISARPRPAAAAAPSVRKPVPRPELPAAQPIQWLWAGLMAVVGFALYANTFGHGLALDDVAAISQNLFVQQGIDGIPDLLKTEFWHFSNISLGYYRPLSLITFALEKEFFDADPSISHLINALLYAATGLVLNILLQKWLPGKSILTTLITLLFLAHPLHTEVVANIKSRDELLSFLLMSGVLLTYWRYLETRTYNWLGWSAVLMYFTYLSKESSLVGLGLIVLMEYTFGKRSFGRALVNVWPFLVVTMLFFLQKQKMIGTLSGTPPIDLANYPYAIEKTKLLTTFKFFAEYVWLMIFPRALSYDYSYNVIPSGSLSDGLTWLGIGLAIGIGWLALRGFRQRTLWGFGLAWMLITMAPGLGFIFFRGGIMAERFMYSPVLGFVIAGVAGANWLLNRLGEQKAPVLQRYGLLGICLITAGLYSFKTVARNEDWKDNFTLFTSGLTYSGNSCQVHRHVANEWINKCMAENNPKLKRQYFDRAIGHLRRSTEIYPGFGEAYFSMAYAYQKLIPNIDSSIYYYKQTIRAASAYAPAYNNLGVIFQERHRYHLASHYFYLSTVVNPAYQDGRNNYENLKKVLNLDVQILPDSLQREGVSALMMMPTAPVRLPNL